ncbi:MAG: DUF3883 domain-containing protein [Muribaculaceae bacterium]|nr:DUF3883 domain-containing protein [Muribaculaceae bacterium]
MNKKEFLECVRSFDIKRYRSNFKLIEQKRKNFTRRFCPGNIRKMNIDDYVQGKGLKDESFCYGLEWGLEHMGKITGATAHKFGIFYSKSKKDYIITKAWNRGSLEKSFRNLANELADLIENAEDGKLEEIRKSPFSKMVKGKILSIYLPEKHLNIFSEDHLDYFIHRLDLDDKVEYKNDVLDKRRVLTEFKESIPEMDKWPLHAFGHFLYTVYPGFPKNSEDNIEYIENIDFVSFNYESLSELPFGKGQGKGNYEAQNKRKKELGERGEYIVMLKEEEILKKNKIRKKPVQISAKDDSAGYDILSYNVDGSKKYIEVKTTNCNPKNFTFFFTANELEAAKMYGKDYHLYVVFQPFSSRPVIADLLNPTFEEAKMCMIPVTYKLHLRKINS